MYWTRDSESNTEYMAHTLIYMHVIRNYNENEHVFC
jgi:hypothetical protein